MALSFTYNPYTGLSAGIPMTIGAPLPHNPSRIAPPHLLVGNAGFVGVNTRWENAHITSGRLHRTSITFIEPAQKKSFYVFDAPRTEDEYRSNIFIDATPPKGMTLRPSSDVDAWTGITGEGFKVISIDKMTSAALIRCEPNASISLFRFDGSVHQLSVVKGKVSTVPLSQKQMAQLRVEQFQEQVDTLNLFLERDIRRLHGIIGGAVRLIPAVKDMAALDVLADFLVEHQVHLTDNLRKEVRWALSDKGHPAAGTFYDGIEASNVVRIASPEAAIKRAAADKRRREKSQRDRDLRAGMRGTSNGGSQQSTGKKKKGNRAKG